MYALRTGAADGGKHGGVPVAIGKLGVAVGLATAIVNPTLIPLMAVGTVAGLIIAKKKIDQHQAIEDEYAAREAQRRAR